MLQNLLILMNEGNIMKQDKIRKCMFKAVDSLFQQHGKRCKRCRKEEIKKIKIGGRGTFYCPRCQKQ